MKNIYAKKFSALYETIEKYMDDRVEIIGNKAGLHILLRVKTSYSENELIQKAVKVGVKVYPSSKCWLGDSSEKYPLILLGFGAIDLDAFDEAIRLLNMAWFKSENLVL